MMRATGIMVGGAAYILHNSSGIYGTNDPSRHRTANLWEMTDPTGHGWTIDQINAARPVIDTLLPVNGELGTGQRWLDRAAADAADHLSRVERARWPGEALRRDDGDGWISMPHGIKALLASRRCGRAPTPRTDPLTDAVVSKGELQEDAIVTLPRCADIVGDKESSIGGVCVSFAAR